MKKVFLFLLPLFISTLVFLGFVYFLNRDSGKGALQVTSIPKSKVYLEGKIIGTTPLCKCDPSQMIPDGDYTVKLVPEDTNLTPFEEKIKITKSVLTVVDRTFGEGLSSEGSVITLTPLPNKKSLELSIISFPDGVSAEADNSPIGTAPLTVETLTESDHEITLTKDGYKEKSVRIRLVSGYKLTLIAFLGINPGILDNNPSPSSSSASLSTSPSVTPALGKVIILQTPTGYLRVRDTGALNGAEVDRVYPGETYDLISEKEGWFEIKLKNGESGWISSDYSQKQ